MIELGYNIKWLSEGAKYFAFKLQVLLKPRFWTSNEDDSFHLFI